MKFSDKVIEIDRELSDLDLFALDFLRILRKHTNYVVVSGYVAILLGRARSSEDIDVIIPKLEFLEFKKLLGELKNNDFYCLNTEEDGDIYEYLRSKVAVRFAKKKMVIPNIELKWAKNRIDDISLEKTITVKLREEKIVISHLELQIAFKEKVLKSPKDLEDARHMRNVAEGHLDLAVIKNMRGC